MKTFTLHVGLHKTGTSAVQRAASLQRDQLKTVGILYPDIGGADAHHQFAMTYRAAFEKGSASAEDRLSKWCSEWQSQRGIRDVLVSSEMFMEDRRCMRELSFFRRYFDVVQVVVYLRRPDLIIESAFNQIVKQSGVTTNIFESKAYFIDFHHALEPIRVGLGRENIKLRIYEPGKVIDNDIFRDLLSTIGYAGECKNFSTPEAVNRSLGLASLEVARTCNRYPIAVRSRFMESLIAVAPEIFGDRERPMVSHYLRDHERMALLDKCAESNERLRREHFPEMKTLFAEPVLDETNGPMMVSHEEVLHTLLRIREYELDLPGGDG